MSVRIFDSHAHYDDLKFQHSSVNLLNELHKNSNVELVLNAAADLSSCKLSKELSETLDFVYFSAGIHPENAHIDMEDKHWLSKIEEFAKHKKCCAIGEIGLDYYYEKETATIQKDVFKKQLQLAEKLSLPVIVHDREAHADCLEIISDFSVIGVFHSYSGSFEMAKILLEKGWYISFNGILTFKNTRKSVEVLQGIWNYKNGMYRNKILVETDSPYLSPVPMRGKINNSGYISYIAEFASELLDITCEEFCELTYINACNFYGLDELI